VHIILKDLLTVHPKYDTSKRCYRKLTTEIRDEIGLCLKKNAAKVSMGLRKQCMIKKDIYSFIHSYLLYKLSFCMQLYYKNGFQEREQE